MAASELVSCRGIDAPPTKLSAGSWITYVIPLSCSEVIELIQDTFIQPFLYLFYKPLTLFWIQWLYYIETPLFLQYTPLFQVSIYIVIKCPFDP